MFPIDDSAKNPAPILPREASAIKELKASEKERSRLAAIIECSDNAIIHKTVDGIVIGWNHGAERQYGYTAEEMLGRSIEILFPPDHYQEYLRIMQKVKDGELVPAFDTVRVRKDGTLVNVSVAVTPIEARDGEVIGASKITHDITRIKKLEAQFIEAQKMEVIGHLAGGVAHDFNNVLAVIMGYSEIILRELDPDNPLRKHVGEIHHASERAVALTRQLLFFSRKQKVMPVVLDLNEVVREMDSMLRRLIDENIEMTVVHGTDFGRIKADSGHIGQVIMNLVVNARDAMPEGGKLTITTSDATLDENYERAHPGTIAGDYVMLSISDTGTGMTDEVKARLYEAFFTTKPKGKGTGLGLATCQTIIQQSRGHIEVHSELARGTIFNIYFPRVDQPITATSKTPGLGLLPRGTETLLVVEDEPSVRLLVRSVLQAQGYQVLSASNGQDALRVAREHSGPPIRLVVTDLIMPLMGGKVMAEWLTTSHPGLKVLFTSGYTEDMVPDREGVEAEVDFLSKPYTPGTIACKVRQMLDT